MFVELLEGRTLMSVTPVNTTVKIDRLEVKADLLKFRSDLASTSATTLADVDTLRNDGLKNDAALKPLFKTFRSDVKKMHMALFSDNLNERVNVLTDQLAIVREQIQILRDHGNSTALTADRTSCWPIA